MWSFAKTFRLVLILFEWILFFFSCELKICSAWDLTRVKGKPKSRSHQRASVVRDRRCKCNSSFIHFSLNLSFFLNFVFFSSSTTVWQYEHFLLQANTFQYSKNHFLRSLTTWKISEKLCGKNSQRGVQSCDNMICWTIFASGCSVRGHSITLPLIGSHWYMSEELVVTISSSSTTMRWFQCVFVQQSSCPIASVIALHYRDPKWLNKLSNQFQDFKNNSGFEAKLSRTKTLDRKYFIFANIDFLIKHVQSFFSNVSPWNLGNDGQKHHLRCLFMKITQISSIMTFSFSWIQSKIKVQLQARLYVITILKVSLHQI